MPTPEQQESSQRKGTLEQASEVDSIIERLDRQTVEFFGETMTVARILQRAGGELVGGFDERWPAEFFKDLGVEPRAGDAHPEDEIRRAMSALMAEKLVSRTQHADVDYRLYVYKLLPLGVDVLKSLRSRA